MVANNDGLVGIGAVDPADYIVHRSDGLTGDDAEVKLDPRGRTRVVIGIQSTDPVGPVDFLPRNAVAVERSQQGFSSRLRDRQRGDPWDDIGDIRARRILVRRIARSSRITGVSREEEGRALLHGVGVSGRAI